jgi:uncharacterized protein YcbX
LIDLNSLDDFQIEEDSVIMHVSGLTVFPVKSLPGVHLTSAECTRYGLQSALLQDRSFMITDKDGKFLTMRTHKERMSKIRLSVQGDHVVLTAPGVMSTSLSLPLYFREGDDGNNYRKQSVRVWSWQGQARKVSDEADCWISKVLDQPAQIVQCCPDSEHSRNVDPDWVSPEMKDTQVRFADGFPYLFVFEESLSDFQSHCNIDVSMDRFRGNIIISGGQPWQEDRIKQMKIETKEGSTIVFDFVKPCSRCTVPTIDPETGIANDTIHRVLYEKRRGSVLGWNEPKSFIHSTFFGVNAIVSSCHPHAQGLSAPVVSVGDAVKLID